MPELREPTLEDLLREPIIATVMKRDGVRGDDIRRLLRHAGARAHQQRFPASGAERRVEAGSGKETGRAI
jgi:hypothetical protein